MFALGNQGRLLRGGDACLAEGGRREIVDEKAVWCAQGPVADLGQSFREQTQTQVILMRNSLN